jgi:hypothetical protein
LVPSVREDRQNGWNKENDIVLGCRITKMSRTNQFFFFKKKKPSKRYHFVPKSKPPLLLVKNHVAQAKNHEAPENPDLRRKVLLGQIKSEVLVTMSGIFFL